MVNKYPGLSYLARKDVFGDMMDFAKLIAPAKYKFTPSTFNLTYESAREAKRFEEYQNRNKDFTYIAKPAKGSKGKGICLFKNLGDLPGELQAEDKTV